MVTHTDKALVWASLEGPSQQSLQEVWAQAEPKQPSHGPGPDSSGNCCIAEVFLATGSIHVDSSTQDLHIFKISRAERKAEFVLYFPSLRVCKTSWSDSLIMQGQQSIPMSGPQATRLYYPDTSLRHIEARHVSSDLKSQNLEDWGRRIFMSSIPNWDPKLSWG